MRTDVPRDEQCLNRAKIMVVDDDPDLRQALSLRLRANHSRPSMFATVIRRLPWRRKKNRT